MKKTNNTKPVNSNLPKPKPGFGFGDAMFAMKDLAADYNQIDAPIGEVKPAIVNKNPIVNQPKKAVIPNKPLSNQPKVIPQNQTSNLPKEVFKIGTGKQFDTNLKITGLNILQSTNNVFELTQAKYLSKWQYNVFCDGFPADKIVQKPQVSFNFGVNDVKQGQLGNCYFITALASISHFKEILLSRIPDHKKYSPYQKSFKVYMFQSGKCIEIIVDNLFPGVYCKPVGNDISPMILEKAYAQVYGNFQVIILGHASDALRDLSGAPTSYLDLKNKQQLRNQIKRAFQYKYGLVIASKAQKVNPSLSPKHSYNIIGFQLINSELFLHLRDPRGWTKAFFDVPSQLQYNPENGQFWISQKQLQSNFEVISICKAQQHFNYYYKAFSQKQLTNRTGGLLFHLKAPMKVFITIHQKHKKFFDIKFTYDIIRLLIAEVDSNKQGLKVIKTIKTDFNAQQVCCIEVDLQARSYLVIGQIGKNKAKDLFSNEIFTISMYCQSKNINFEQVTGNIDIKPYLMNYIVQNKEQFKESFSEQGIYRYQGPLFGYICMYYQNRGQKHAIEEIEYTVKNIQISQKKVDLLPNQSKLIIHAIGPENNCSHQCSMKSKTLYK